MTVGAAVIIAGLLLLLATNGWLALTLLDLMGIALILSGVLFWIPGLAWRHTIPWITSLFIPGSVAFAAGGILIYAGHVHLRELAYLWTALPLAVGLAFVAMYYLGPRQRWLWVAGAVMGAISAAVFGTLLAVFASLPGARIAGAVILISLGLIFAIRALAARKSSTQLAPRGE